MTLVKKVFAYITHAGRLLVFSHPDHPEAGIQVPVGTVKEGERPETAVLREAFEETGLEGLELIAFLGEQQRHMGDFGLDHVHHRYFFHLRYRGNPPETWRHYEMDPSGGSSRPIAFDFFWAPLPDRVPVLMADHDAMLPRLRRTIVNTRDELPFVCDMTALEPAQREQHTITSSQLFQVVQEVRELPDGYAFRLPNDSATLLLAAEFVAGERLCCPFFGFALELEPHGGPFWLRLTGRDGIKDFIQAEISDHLSLS